MGKTETMRNLDTAQPQLQIIQGLQDLEQQMVQMQELLRTLPEKPGAISGQELAEQAEALKKVAASLENSARVMARLVGEIRQLREDVPGTGWMPCPPSCGYP